MTPGRHELGEGPPGEKRGELPANGELPASDQLPTSDELPTNDELLTSEERPPYAMAVLAAATVFGLYVLTLAPTIGFWDSSEYIATAHILGIPHPPGNPLFVALGKTWLTLLAPSELSVAVRMNLFAAATSATAAGFFFLVAHRILGGARPTQRDRSVEPEGDAALAVVHAPRWVPRAGAWAATLLAGTAFTVWSQSTVNEKVYTLSVAIIAAVSWLTVRWLDRRHEPGSERLLLVAGYLMVLGSTSHLMSVLALPAVAVAVMLAGGAVVLRPRFLLRAAPLLVLGLSFNFFLPVRAAQDPVINEAEPTCESMVGAAVAVFTVGRAGCPPLASALSRQQYAKPPVTERQAPFRAQLLNWFQYFDWQWARGAAASEVPGNARLPFSLLFIGLGLAGLWATYRSDPHIAAYLATLALVLTVGLVWYLNFRYGSSLYPEVTDRDLHEVRERDYFFIAGFMLWGMLAGVGLTWAWSVVARELRRPRSHLLTAPVLAVAAIPLLLNWSWASRSGDYAPVDWAYDLLMSVEPYAVLFTNGDNDTFPLWYLQEVEGVRRDVTVVVGQYLYTTWYPRQLQRLTAPDRQRPFEPGPMGGFYDRVPAPSGSIVELEPEQLDLVAGGVLDEDMTVAFPRLAVTFPAGAALDRSERLALIIIHDSLGDRPVYFATALGMMQQLGLDRWAVRHGLVSRLEARGPSTEDPDHWVEASPNLGGETFDVPRTRTLYEDVYRFRGLEDRRVWPDRTTLNIPWQFYALALQLADVGAKRGMDGTWVARLQDDARRFLVTARGGSEGTPE